MKRQMWNAGTVVVLLASVMTGACREIGDAIGETVSPQEAPLATQNRLEEELGELAPLDTTAAARLSGAFRAASARALPAVVQIRTVAVTELPTGGFFPGMSQGTVPHRTQGTGSGFIFDPRGYILTNHHVVRNALSVNVMMLDGREYTAEVIGGDVSSDVAVVRIDPAGQELPIIELGDSDNIRVGDWVIALGNPMGLTFTATAGIVSARGRSIGILAETAGETALESFIQTDAAINPGNSGGPLVDLNGRVIGINTAIESGTGFFTGAGFAIPIALARKMADDIIEYGTVHRPRLGIVIENVTAADAEVYRLPAVQGVEVVSVTPGTPADRAGLQLGDVILTINDEAVNTVPELQARIARFQPGDRVRLGFIRYGTSLATTVQLGEFEQPPQRTAAELPRREGGNPLGFSFAPLPAQIRNPALAGSPPVVSRVDPVGPAAGSGLERGHVIRRFNGREVASVRDLERAVGQVRAGQVVSLIVARMDDPQLVPRIVNFRIQ